jgi:hypothetical protein
MKISYKMRRYASSLPGLRPEYLWRCTYTITDPNHPSPPIIPGSSAIFKKGDLIDLAFPVINQDSPVYTNVQAAADVNTKQWKILVNFDFSGIDFGLAYRVIYTALVDNAKLNSFNVYFLWNGSGTPGSQPWGFTNARSLNQHDELGQTIP